MSNIATVSVSFVRTNQVKVISKLVTLIFSNVVFHIYLGLWVNKQLSPPVNGRG